VNEGWEGARGVGWEGGIEGRGHFLDPYKNMAGWLAGCLAGK